MQTLFLSMQYNTDAHNTHTHSSLWTHVHKPYPYEHLRKTWTSRSGDSWSHHWRLVVDGDVAYHLKHNAGKSWNKSRKVRALVPSRGLEPGWVGSTTRDLTNWSMISSIIRMSKKAQEELRILFFLRNRKEHPSWLYIKKWKKIFICKIKKKRQGNGRNLASW